MPKFRRHVFQIRYLPWKTIRFEELLPKFAQTAYVSREYCHEVRQSRVFRPGGIRFGYFLPLRGIKARIRKCSLGQSPEFPVLRPRFQPEFQVSGSRLQPGLQVSGSRLQPEFQPRKTRASPDSHSSIENGIWSLSLNSRIYDLPLFSWGLSPFPPSGNPGAVPISPPVGIRGLSSFPRLWESGTCPYFLRPRSKAQIADSHSTSRACDGLGN